MTQQSLLEYRPPAPRQSVQAANLARVSGRIADLIVEFCRARIEQEFYADELRAFMAEREPTAPGSADRVLRALRQAGRVKYACVSRAASRYRVIAVAGSDADH